MYRSINRAIVEYLTQNKRLVIPNLGAFIRRDNAEVVFVEFLKKDDGVLNALVQSELKVGERVAGDAIDEYVVEVTNSVVRDGGYTIDKLGTIRRDKDGIYELVYDINAHSQTSARTQAQKPTEQRIQPPAVETPRAEQPQTRRESVQQPAPTQSQRPIAQPTTQRVESRTKPQQPRQQPQPERRSAADDMHIRKKKRADLVMIIAIVAALVAIGVMVFGMMVGNDPMTSIEPTSPQMEQVETAPQPNEGTTE